MKKILILIALAIACSISFSQNAKAAFEQGDDSLSNKATTEIQHDFPKAQNIIWKKSGRKYVAFFHSENGKVVATYNKRGKLLIVIINSDAKYIPSDIQVALAKKYPAYSPQYMKKFIKREKNSYYILLRSQSHKLVNWLMVKTDDKGKFKVVQQLQQPV